MVQRRRRARLQGLEPDWSFLRQLLYPSAELGAAGPLDQELSERDAEMKHKPSHSRYAFCVDMAGIIGWLELDPCSVSAECTSLQRIQIPTLSAFRDAGTSSISISPVAPSPGASPEVVLQNLHSFR